MMHFASRSEKLKTENKINFYMHVLGIYKDSVYVHFGDNLGPKTHRQPRKCYYLLFLQQLVNLFAHL